MFRLYIVVLYVFSGDTLPVHNASEHLLFNHLEKSTEDDLVKILRRENVVSNSFNETSDKQREYISKGAQLEDMASDDSAISTQELPPQRHMNVHITKYSANRGVSEDIVSSEHIVHRVRRFYYDEAEDYPFYYDNEFYYDYYDYLNAEEELSLLEWLNEQAEEYVVVGTIGFLVFLVTCFCCACACRELRMAICYHCCRCCDKMHGRDPKYRDYVNYCERLNLPKPSYSEYKMTTGQGQKRSFGEKYFG